jgi:hypothetical protein
MIGLAVAIVASREVYTAKQPKFVYIIFSDGTEMIVE